MAAITLTSADLNGYSIDQLRYYNMVTPTSLDDYGWRNTIFPAQTPTRPELTLEHQISKIPDTALVGWDVMEGLSVVRSVDGPLLDELGYPKPVKFHYQAERYGAYNNSVKRLTDLRTPLDESYSSWDSYVQLVLDWARKKEGLRRLYCITEHRPYVFNRSWVLNAVYYTVIGCP